MPRKSSAIDDSGSKDNLLNSSSLTADKKQKIVSSQQSKVHQANSVFIWTAIFLLTVPLAYYGYLSCQLLRTTNEQQLQLELLHRRLENLTVFVNGVVVSTATNDHPKRVKRQNSVQHRSQHHQQQHQQSVQIGQKFRWIEPNWTEEDEPELEVEKSNYDFNRDAKSESTKKKHHSRRQVENIPDTDVHFFSTPRPPPNSAHRSAGDSNYEWLSSYSRVSVSGHMHAYYLPFPFIHFVLFYRSSPHPF